MYPVLTARVINLARRTKITEDDWYTLLDERLQTLKDSLREMTLKELGSLKYLSDYFHEHSIQRDEPEFLGDFPTFSLKTRGIFPPESGESMLRNGFTIRDYSVVCSQDDVYGQEGKVFASSTSRCWGLTRKGQWIGIEVRSDHSFTQYKSPERFERVEIAKTVSAREMSLPELCAFAGVTPRNIWDRLGEVVEQWVKDRQHLLANAQRIDAFFAHEKALVNSICPRPT